MKTLVEVAREHKLEEICLPCDLYNSDGCSNTKGKILCKTRDYLIKQIKNIPLKNIPYNWRNESR